MIDVALLSQWLDAQGCAGWAFDISPAGLGDLAALSSDQRARVEAAFAAFDPAWVPPVPVPQQVPMWAAQAALKQGGKYEAINTFILGLENTNAPVFFAWTMGNFASRQSAFIAALAAQFGMAPADIDAVFILADRIAAVAG